MRYSWREYSESKVTKEDEVIEYGCKACRVGCGFLEDFNMDEVLGVIKFTSGSSKCMMTTAKDGHAGTIIERGSQNPEPNSIWEGRPVRQVELGLTES